MHSCGFSFQLQLCTLILQFSFQHCLNELDGEDPVGIKQSIVSLTATRSCCGQCFDFIHCCLFLKWWVVGGRAHFSLVAQYFSKPSLQCLCGPYVQSSGGQHVCLTQPSMPDRATPENRTCFHLQLCILVDSLFNFSCAL